MQRFENQVAIVTGGGRGIGAATAWRLASEGAAVVVADVDLEAVADQTDIQALFNLISRHSELTNSPRARWILDHWATMLPLFVKVFPHEYKRVLNLPRATSIYIPQRQPIVPTGVAHG